MACKNQVSLMPSPSCVWVLHVHVCVLVHVSKPQMCVYL